MKFIDLNIDEYCKTNTPKLSRIIDCIDSAMRIRGCGSCLADLFQCNINDNSQKNIKNFLSYWQIMLTDYFCGNHPINSYSVKTVNELFTKYENLYKKIYRYQKMKIPDDPYFQGHYKLIGCTTLITYDASFIDVEYFTNDKPLPLDILEILRRDGLRLNDVEEQTEEYCRAAISNNGLALQFVKDKTDALCWQAVGMDGDALQFCPVQTEELCVRAVRQKGRSLRFVKKQTPFVCLVAIEKDVNALQYVQNKTPKICMAAVQLHGKALQYVPEQTEELCLAAVQSWGKALQFVKNKTPEICAAALKQSSEAMPFIEICDEDGALQILKWDREGELLPRLPYRSDDFLRKAIALSPESIRHIRQTPELCMIAVINNGYTIRHMEQTPDLCWAALYQNENSIDYIKNPTYEMYLYVVMREGWYLKNCEEQTMEMCAAAYLQRPSNIEYIRDKSITVNKLEEYLYANEDLCVKMIPFSCMALKYIKNQTEEMCINAVSCNGESLEYVIHQTTAIQVAAVRETVYALKFIPHEEQSEEIVITALLSGPMYFSKSYLERLNLAQYENMKNCEELSEVFANENLWQSVVSEYGQLLQFCPNKTYAVCLASVKNDASAFQFVPPKMQSPELKQIALKARPQNMFWVKTQTHEDCLAMFDWCLNNKREKWRFPITSKKQLKWGIESIRNPGIRLQYSNLLESDYLYRHLF